jgi:hypothetical protein
MEKLKFLHFNPYSRYSSIRINTKDDILCNFKNLPQKLGQAADEIFRVAAWTRSELAVI